MCLSFHKDVKHWRDGGVIYVNEHKIIFCSLIDILPRLFLFFLFLEVSLTILSSAFTNNSQKYVNEFQYQIVMNSSFVHIHAGKMLRD
jgi:hypothetical protein